jgi:hypothetical protein
MTARPSAPSTANRSWWTHPPAPHDEFVQHGTRWANTVGPKGWNATPDCGCDLHKDGWSVTVTFTMTVPGNSYSVLEEATATVWFEPTRRSPRRGPTRTGSPPRAPSSGRPGTPAHATGRSAARPRSAPRGTASAATATRWASSSSPREITRSCISWATRPGRTNTSRFPTFPAPRGARSRFRCRCTPRSGGSTTRAGESSAPTGTC